MIKRAQKDGHASEDAMWKSVARIDGLLEKIKDCHPDEYWDFLRKTHEDMYGAHYNEEYAKYDLERLHYTDSSGMENRGPHWTRDQVVAAMANREFPTGTTDYDKWVAANVAFSDFCKKFKESEILEIAYLFFFADEDYEHEGKIWHYMCAMK